MLTRFPFVGHGHVPVGYPVTGVQEVKDSVNRTPKPPPAAPAGVAALEAEIGANNARQDAIRAELAGLEEAYQAAALQWDVDQVVSARTEMNAAADKRRALQIELTELGDDLPRLQKRLQAARTAQRQAEHVEDLAQLERCLDEFAPVVAEYQQLCVDLVELAQELHTRRNEVVRLRRKTDEWAQHSGAERCPRDVSRESAIPPFYAQWLDGAARNVADAKKAMGLD